MPLPTWVAFVVTLMKTLLIAMTGAPRHDCDNSNRSSQRDHANGINDQCFHSRHAGGAEVDGGLAAAQEPSAGEAHDPAEDEHLRHLGVAVMTDDTRVAQIVEKPESPPSKFAVTGIYFYDAQVWDVLPTLRPSGRGELEITDVNNWYVGRQAMEADVVEGFWGDAGESIDAYYEVNDFVRRAGVNR